MRKRLALGLILAVLPLSGCLATGGGSAWQIGVGSGVGKFPQNQGYWPSPYPGYAVPYGHYPYSRFEPSPFFGTRPVFPHHNGPRCVRDRLGRLWC